MTAHILLIDFEQRSLQATRALLEGAGFRVQTARTGREAEQFLRDPHLDLVILEPMIPGQDGFKLIASIKKRSRAGQAPRVVVASRIYRGPKYRAMSRDAGADSYLERPQQDDLLLPTIEKLLPGWRPAAAPSSDRIEYVSAAHVIPVPESDANMESAPPLAPRFEAPAAPPASVATSARADAPQARMTVAPLPEDENELTGITEFDIEDALNRVLGSEFSQPTGDSPTAVQSVLEAADEVASAVLEAPAIQPPPEPAAARVPDSADFDGGDILGLEGLSAGAAAEHEHTAEEELDLLSSRVGQLLAAVPVAPVLGQETAESGAEPAGETVSGAHLDGGAAKDVVDAIVSRLDGFGADPDLAADTPIGGSSGEEDLSSRAPSPDDRPGRDAASVRALLDDLVCPDDLTLEQAFAVTDTPGPAAEVAAAARGGAARASAVAHPPETGSGGLADALQALDTGQPSSSEKPAPVIDEVDPDLPDDFAAALDRLELTSEAMPSAEMPSAPVIFDAESEDLDTFTAGLVSKEEAESAEFEELPELIPEAGLSIKQAVEDAAPAVTPDAPAAAASASLVEAAAGAVAEPQDKQPAARADRPGPVVGDARRGELDLDAELERAFSGFSSGETDEATTGGQGERGAADHGGPERQPRADEAPQEVPEHLKGMDAGTADLLRSLEELENSMPPDIPAASGQGWVGSAGFNDPTCEFGASLIPLSSPAPAPASAASANAQKLEEVISHIQAAAPKLEDSTGVTSSEGLVVEPLAGPLYGDTADSLAKPRRRAEELGGEPFRTFAATSSPASGRRAWTGLFLMLLAIGVVAAGILSWIFLYNGKSAQDAGAPPAADATVAETPASSPAIETPAPVVQQRAPGRRAQAAPKTGGERKLGGDARLDPRPAAPRPETGAAKVIQTPPAVSRNSAPSAAAATPTPASGAATTVEDGQPSPGPATETATEATDRPAPIVPNQVESRPPTPAALVRLAELDSPLQLVTSPPPASTSEAQGAGVGGRVILSVLVDEYGAVADARVIVEPGYGLGAAAMEAVRGWRYSVPLRGGQPARVWKTEEITFKAPGDGGAGAP